MLVLTRRRQQGIRLGSDIRIVVLEISGDQVRLGIDAPRDQAILRDEVFARVAAANSAAAERLAPAEDPAGWLNFDHAKLGALRVRAQDVIHIDAMPGFPMLRRFVLIEHDRGEGIAWLASCEDANLAFPVVDLRSIRPDVCGDLSEAELARVGAEDPACVELLGIFSTREAKPRINLDAPVLIHRETRRAAQLIREHPLALG